MKDSYEDDAFMNEFGKFNSFLNSFLSTDEPGLGVTAP
jgi:hypothetical protein